MVHEGVFTVGDVVRKLRKERNWSIRQLADASKVGRMTISAIERNTSNYQKETLDALAIAFNHTGAELEAMAQPRLPRRVDTDLPVELLAFARRMLRLTRKGRMAMEVLLLAFEEGGTAKAPDEPNGDNGGTGSVDPIAVAHKK